MQFIQNGPDIPERLLQNHEEGRVVFFCGAGISYPAGLPGFEGLVNRLYQNLAMEPNSVQKVALKARQYDIAIAQLEGSHVGGRMAVRKELAAILNSPNTSPEATRTHEALLTLSRRRDGKLRLLTTNFDRLFQIVIERKQLTVRSYQAPLLPVPKNRWDGLVYLHGLLSPTPIESELDNLVVSSGDFGLAYLVERWAARFVGELFRHYIVCFVGYSLNDPVLRYMADALAADNQRGETPLEMYAFGSYKRGRQEAYESEWRAKNVTPILYRETKDHRYLHMSLHRWSETYRDGALGKELIVVKEAIGNPQITTREDDFVGRVLWALSDEGGLPAKRFAEMDPVPALSWLEPLSENRYKQGDLVRFGVPPKADQDDKLTFSLIRRPASYERAPLMALCDNGATGSQWDEVMHQLARWLTRHLDDPNLVIWIAKRGGQLNDQFAWLIDDYLNKIEKLDRQNKTDEINRMRAGAPLSIPRPLLRTLWHLLLSGRVRSGRQDHSLYRWQDRFDRDGWSPSLRLSLRELLTPCIQLSEPFHWSAAESDEEQHPRENVDWELRLHAGHVHTALRRLQGDPRWQAALPDLLPDLTLLLRDALDLERELGGANDLSDLSYVQHPSIAEHPQNRHYRDWTALIDLVRDAWLEVARTSVEQARLFSQQWLLAPYPLFKRLAFFAATHKNTISPALAVDWLLSHDHWWLWSTETQREAIRLLAVLSPKLEAADLNRLEDAILDGPPRSMFKDDVDTELWVDIVDHSIWLRLMKMTSAGVLLGERAQVVQKTLCEKHPEWQIESDEQDEFPFWMGDGDDSHKFTATPRRRRDLVEWLKQHPSTDVRHKDDWRQRCSVNFATTACALYALSAEDIWPVDRWSEALQVWEEEKLLKRSWKYMAPLLARAPLDVVRKLDHSASRWLKALARNFTGHEDLFLPMCRLILANVDHRAELDSDDPVSRAINHPVGIITEALLRWWYRRELKDDQLLPDELKPTLTLLCDPNVPIYQHARVVLAERTVTLFRVDPEWTKQNLLSYLDWKQPTKEARAAWQGFLLSPRFYPGLFELIKAAFLETASHYVELGRYGGQFAALLTFIALEPQDVLNRNELRKATETLPQEGRKQAVRALERALEGSGEQRAEYWHNRVLPYWRSIWPSSRDSKVRALAEPIAQLCLAAGDRFPEALSVLRSWLQPIEHPYYLIHLLVEQRLAARYPSDALEFLNIVVDTRLHWPPPELRECLNAIKAAQPGLEEDTRFRRLMELVRLRD